MQEAGSRYQINQSSLEQRVSDLTRFKMQDKKCKSSHGLNAIKSLLRRVIVKQSGI